VSHNHDHRDLRPAPALDGRQTARVGLSLAGKEIADYVAALVPTSDDENKAPGEFVARAIQNRIMGLELLHRAVTVELMRGTSWETIAGQFNLTVEQLQHQFGHCDLTHLADAAGITGVWPVLAETCICPAPILCDPDPGRTALHLDDWYLAYTSGQPGDPAALPQDQAVTTSL
jgi:hypothetical protein